MLSQRPGLTVISADPWSGTTELLRLAREPLYPATIVDARRASDALDLAMAIADTVVATFEPQSFPWWLGSTSQMTGESLRLARAASTIGVDLDELRFGSGAPGARLRDAFVLAASIPGEAPLLMIDHLGILLAAVGRTEARLILSELRAAKQEHRELDLVLVEHSGGQISKALRDKDHPLYQAGQVLRFRRPDPQRFESDLVITRAVTDVPVDLIGAAAELAVGVPALTWRIVELVPTDQRGDSETLALSGWRRLRQITEPAYARMWDTIRRVHSSALDVIAAMSLGIGPYAAPAADKTVNDCLSRLREIGVVWQPRSRTWAITDPLLAAWARDNAASWVLRKHASRLE